MTNDFKKRNELMHELRYERGWTLQRIADRFGVSRERIRQITGNAGNLSAKMRNKKLRAAIDAADALVKVDDLAERIGVAPGFVRRYSSEHTNREWVVWVGKQLRARGHDVRIGDRRKALINIDNRLSACVSSATPTQMSSGYYHYTFHGNKSRQHDFMICVLRDKLETYVVPVAAFPGYSISIPDPYRYGKYKQFREAWELLKQ